MPTLVRLKAFGDPGIPVNAYNGLLTFASSDAAAAYGGEIDASRQVRMQCNCGDGRAFPVTLNTSGMQTVTVTDEFGTTDQLTIEVLAAPPAVAAPVTGSVVQWSHGTTLDFYVSNPTGADLTVIESTTNCSVIGSGTIDATVNQRLDQYASFSVPIPYADCYYHDQYEMNITSLTVVDTLGHVWTIGTPRYHRFAEVPGNSSFETLNDGDPFDSSNLVPGQASASCGKTWSTERQSWYCRGSIGVAVAPYGDARVAASSYFGQDGAVYWPGGDAVFLPAGQSTITVAYDPWVCYFTPRGTTVLRLDYVDPASGHRGWRQWGLGGPYVSAPANL